MGNSVILPSDFTTAAPDAINISEQEEIKESYERAKALYQQAIKYAEPESDEMANCYDRLGCLQVRSGELEAALKSFKKSLEIKKKNSPNSSSVAKTLSNIASVYSGKGEHDKALTILDECLAIREKKDPNSLRLAKTYSNIAVVLSNLEQYDKAAEYHELAFEIKKLQAPGSVSMATTCVNLANLCMRTDPPRAIFYLKRAKLIAETSRPVPYGVLSDVFTVTGHILRHADMFDDAVEMYRKAIQLESSTMVDSPKIQMLEGEIERTKKDAENTTADEKPSCEGIEAVAEKLRTMEINPDITIPIAYAVPDNMLAAPENALEHVGSFSSSIHFGAGGYGGGGMVLPYPPSIDPVADGDGISRAHTSPTMVESGPSDRSQRLMHLYPPLPPHSHYQPHHPVQRAMSLTSLPEEDEQRFPRQDGRQSAFDTPSFIQPAIPSPPSFSGDSLDRLVSMTDSKKIEERESSHNSPRARYYASLLDNARSTIEDTLSHFSLSSNPQENPQRTDAPMNTFYSGALSLPSLLQNPMSGRDDNHTTPSNPLPFQDRDEWLERNILPYSPHVDSLRNSFSMGHIPPSPYSFPQSNSLPAGFEPGLTEEATHSSKPRGRGRKRHLRRKSNGKLVGQMV